MASWALLALLLAGSSWASYASYRLMQQRRADAFQAQSDLLKLRLEDRLDLYRNLSRTLLGYFQASHSVKQSGWRSYVLAQQLDRHYPFLQHVWFAFDMANEMADEYLEQRADPEQVATLWAWEEQGGERQSPVAPRSRKLPLLYLYPADAYRLGLDIYAAQGSIIERAYRQRETVLSANFALLPGVPTEFAFITPLFRQHELASNATPSLEGVIGVSFSSTKLFLRLLAEVPAGLSLEVYRGHHAVAQSLLFDNDGTPLEHYPNPPAHVRIVRATYDSEPITLVFHAPRFWQVPGIEDFTPLYVAGSGLLISLLGFAIAWSLESTRVRATAIADRMTLELRNVNAVLAQMATTDSLTGLLNRRAFVDRLDGELQRVQRYGEHCAVLMLDVDHFKSINDRYGHPAGDQVLRNIGQLLLTELRSADVPARMGGEEFAVLLPHTDLEQARQVAEQLRTKLASLIHQDGELAFQCSASFGAASTASGTAASGAALLKQADRALYQAKNAGRNRVIAMSEVSEASP